MNYKIGEMQEFSKTISEIDVHGFASISGDFNSVHVNKDAAKKSVFGKQIAHGMLVGSLISNVIGMKLPGDGTIYMEQHMKFLKPVYIGDTVTARVIVSDIINEGKNILRLSTQVFNQNAEMVIDGYAVVKAPREGERDE